MYRQIANNQIAALKNNKTTKSTTTRKHDESKGYIYARGQLNNDRREQVYSRIEDKCARLSNVKVARLLLLLRAMLAIVVAELRGGFNRGRGVPFVSCAAMR